MSQIRGSSGNLVDVNTSGQLKIIPETDASLNASKVGSYRSFGENDQGTVTGVVRLRSGEVDVDYRQRLSSDLTLDEEVFNGTAQNTGKHKYSNTTMTNTWTAGQLTTNGSSITTTTTGSQLETYAFFPNIGTNTLSLDTEVAFSNTPVTNSFVEFGLGIPGTSTTAPTDGVFFRLNSSGLQGIASNNGTETSTGVFPLSNGTGTWAYTINKRYQFIVYVGGVEAQFWVNDGTGAVLLGNIPLPAGQGRICMASGLQYFHKHRITGGAAGGVLQSFVGAYNVRLGGASFSNVPSTNGNRMYGSYQALSGGTMGGLSKYTNNTNATAAVPTNTTAALGTGLGGEFWETDTLAVNTDGIIMSYQIPATINTPNRRLVVRGLKIDTYVQTALTGGGYNEVWNVAFGHTAVSLATAEAATTKKPRFVMIGTRTVASAAAALTQLPTLTLDTGDAPIFVNPGEFIQITKKKVGTAPTAGVMAHNITLIYGWE